MTIYSVDLKNYSLNNPLRTIGLFCCLGLATPVFAADDRKSLVASAKEQCLATAMAIYKVEADQVKIVKDRAAKYHSGMRGAILPLSIEGSVGRRTCIVKKAGKVSFTRNTNLR